MSQPTDIVSANGAPPAVEAVPTEKSLISVPRRRPRPAATELTSRVRSGVPVASFREYADAESAIDVLAEAGIPVQQLAIVGCDLRLLESTRGGERITSRPFWLRAAGYGAISGAWLGTLVGIVFG